MRKKMNEPAHVSSVLQDAIKAARVDINPAACGIWKQWQDVVGPTIAENARPEAIKGKLLLVNVSSAPWMQQLQFLKAELVEKLNESLGREVVQDIRFKIGPVDDRP
jgi:predicted nucleic acid-binding Zn ribbon protein